MANGADLTGVASTENIRTNTNATFLQNINVGVAITAGKLGIGFTDTNIKIGNTALDSLTVSNGNNIAVGHHALTATTGYSNIGVGGNALDANTTGYNNVAIGKDALGQNHNGSKILLLVKMHYNQTQLEINNVAIGVQILNANTTE